MAAITLTLALTETGNTAVAVRPMPQVIMMHACMRIRREFSVREKLNPRSQSRLPQILRLAGGAPRGFFYPRHHNPDFGSIVRLGPGRLPLGGRLPKLEGSIRLLIKGKSYVIGLFFPAPCGRN